MKRRAAETQEQREAQDREIGILHVGRAKILSAEHLRIDVKRLRNE